MNNAFGFNNYAPQYQPFFPNISTASQQLVKVKGIEGAKAYHMNPNSIVALFHESEDIMYIKSMDGGGYPSIQTFRFVKLEDEPQEEYVTKKEFNDLKTQIMELANGK